MPEDEKKVMELIHTEKKISIKLVTGKELARWLKKLVEVLKMLLAHIPSV